MKLPDVGVLRSCEDLKSGAQFPIEAGVFRTHWFVHNQDCVGGFGDDQKNYRQGAEQRLHEFPSHRCLLVDGQLPNV